MDEDEKGEGSSSPSASSVEEMEEGTIKMIRLDKHEDKEDYAEEIVEDSNDNTAEEDEEQEEEQKKAKKKKKKHLSVRIYEVLSSGEGLTFKKKGDKVARVQQQLCLSFEGVSYSVKVSRAEEDEDNNNKTSSYWKYFINTIRLRKNPLRRHTRHILNNLSGCFFPGRLSAIMGPSGSGKTSLLNFLSKRLRAGSREGTVTVNGIKLSRDKMKKLSAYVMQEDTLLPNLTPRELFGYAAQLRLPRGMSKKVKKERVKWVIDKLGLTRCKNTRVGIPGEGKGISGGERRRVSIGLELITNPNILFLDEPTSGLDSATAEQVVRILKELAGEGRTVICTIHQPSSEIFNMFDDVLLLCKGSIPYLGPVTSLVPHFKKQGYVCPKFSNPADCLMRLLVHNPHEEDQSQFKERLQNFVEYHSQNSPALSIEEVEKDSLLDLSAPPIIVDSRPFFLKTFFILWRRCWTQYIRDPVVARSRFFQTVIVMMLVGFLYWQLDNDQTSISTRLGLLFLVVVYMLFATGLTSLNHFPSEKGNFLREYSNGMYSVASYYFAKSTADLPFTFFYPIMFSSVCYWMAGLKIEADAFFVFMSIMIVVSNVAQSVAFLVSAVTSIEVALVLYPLSIMPFMLGGGLFIPVNDIPVWFIWLPYTSYCFYSYCGLCLNEFKGTDYYCKESQKVAGVCPVTTGEQVLEHIGFQDFEIYQCFIGLMGLFFIVRFLTFLCLYYLARRKGLG